MLINELRDLLRELTVTIGAVSAAVVHERPGEAARIGSERHVALLGKGAFLCVELPLVAAPKPPTGPRDVDKSDVRTDARGRDHGLAIEQCARALRACTRRWGEEKVPAVALGGPAAPSSDRVEARIKAFLQALTNVQNAVDAVVARRGQVVASAGEMTEYQRAQVPFTHRRLDVEASRKRDSSHAELSSDDYFAVSFWYDACLIVFFSAPYAVDFVRHRVRQVTRELSHLLPLLDEPPPSGVNIAPIPD